MSPFDQLVCESLIALRLCYVPAPMLAPEGPPAAPQSTLERVRFVTMGERAGGHPGPVEGILVGSATREIDLPSKEGP
jgi:hypothetical protein